MELDEIAALKLDEEFKTKLKLIRPHVLALKSSIAIHLVRLWLDKLSHCLTYDRITRNEYLSELHHQLEMGGLQSPFDKPPPDMLLSYQRKETKSIEERKESSNSSSWSDITESNDVESFAQPKHTLVQGLENNKPALHGSISTISEKHIRHIHQLPQQKYHPVSRQNGLYHHREKDIGALMATIKDLQEQNEFLRHEVVHYQNLVAVVDAYTSSLVEENKSLKHKLKEIEVKNFRLDSTHHQVITQSQTEMRSKPVQSSENITYAQNRSHSMDESVQNMMQRLEALESQKESRELEWQKKVQREAAIFRNKFIEVEKKHSSRVQQFESTIYSLNEKLSVKTAEVNFLKRSVRKYEKCNNKITQDFHKKFTVLKKRKELEIKRVQLLSKIQKAMSTTAVATEERKELEKAILKLENSYCQMITDIEAKAAQQHQEDSQKIINLEAHLAHIQIRQQPIGLHLPFLPHPPQYPGIISEKICF